MSKVILVTGGNRGIGLAIVQRLLETDSTLSVIIGCRSATDGAAAVAELKQKGLSGASSISLDITSDASIASAVKAVQDTHGKLDVLVNNAGASTAAGTLREQHAALYSLNVISVGATMDAFAPLLQKSADARIVNLSTSMGSIAQHAAGFYPPNFVVPYSTSKAALNILTVQFHNAHPEMEVNAVCPGYCKTRLTNFAGTRDPLEGANVVVILSLEEKGKYPGKGFWTTEGDSMVPKTLPW